MSRSELYQLAASLGLGLLVVLGIIKIAALRADWERRKRPRTSSNAERVRRRNQTVFDRGSTEGQERMVGFGDRLPLFLLLLAGSLGFACWIGGSCAISESCFAHEEIDTSTRDFAWLCGGPVIVLISWVVPVLAYRKLSRPPVLVLGAGFTVVFILVGFGVLAGLLDCF